MIKYWYVLYTKLKCESKVSSLLSKKKFDNYCPVNKITCGGNEKFLLDPLFPSLVFVYITPDQIEYIKQQNDIINFVYWLGQPVQLKGIEIESIQEFVAVYSNVFIEKSDVSLNKMFRVVIKQPMISTEDDVIVLNRTIIKLTLPTLGFTLCALTSYNNVGFSEEEYRIPQMVS
jgi:transcription antitermination factor NusG